MNKFSITMVTLVTMTGFALAQPKADPKTGSAGGSAATGAGATMKAGAGTGSAGAAAGAKAGTGSAGATAGAKAGATTGTTTPAPAAAMTPPKPPTEIKDTLKMMGARQNCTGVTWGGPDGKQEMKMKGTGTNALALDGWWIKGTANMAMGEGKAKMTLKIESYMTWDAKAAVWRSVGVANDGSLMVGTATMKDGKFESQSDMFGGMMGNGKFREHGDMTDMKAGAKMSGEMSMDGGKTWNKVYEMTCKK